MNDVLSWRLGGTLVAIGLATGTLTGLTGASGMSILISALLLVGIDIRQVIGLTFGLNIRLAKCGGPWLSSQIVELARDHNLRFACGAMVGETPILATAGAHFAALHRDHLYLQGFSHRLLHRRRFASNEPTFSRGGILDIDGRGAGLGLQVDGSVLDALTICREVFQL